MGFLSCAGVTIWVVPSAYKRHDRLCNFSHRQSERRRKAPGSRRQRRTGPMGDNRTAALPDGTDTIIEGAAKTEDGGTATVEDTALVIEREIPAPGGDAERPVTGSGSPEGGLRTGSPGGDTSSQGIMAERFRSCRE